jgi:hypothetical protein
MCEISPRQHLCWSTELVTPVQISKKEQISYEVQDTWSTVQRFVEIGRAIIDATAVSKIHRIDYGVFGRNEFE